MCDHGDVCSSIRPGAHGAPDPGTARRRDQHRVGRRARLGRRSGARVSASPLSTARLSRCGTPGRRPRGRARAACRRARPGTCSRSAHCATTSPASERDAPRQTPAERRPSFPGTPRSPVPTATPRAPAATPASLLQAEDPVLRAASIEALIGEAGSRLTFAERPKFEQISTARVLPLRPEAPALRAAKNCTSLRGVMSSHQEHWARAAVPRCSACCSGLVAGPPSGLLQRRRARRGSFRIRQPISPAG